MSDLDKVEVIVMTELDNEFNYYFTNNNEYIGRVPKKNKE